MMRDDNYKYAVSRSGDGIMLYDVDRDRDEQHNMAGDRGTETVEREKRDVLLRRLARTPNKMRLSSNPL